MIFAFLYGSLLPTEGQRVKVGGGGGDGGGSGDGDGDGVFLRM